MRQSGYPAFRLLNPLSDEEIVKRSWSESDTLIGGDPELKRPNNRVVADYFRTYYKSRIEFAEIG